MSDIMQKAHRISHEDARRIVWGNPGKGFVSDWFYARNEKVCLNIFQIPAGEFAGHTDEERAIFGADEIFVILEGEMLLVNPETGEALRAKAGDATFFRKDTWNNAFSIGDTPLRGLEFFHPSPDLGTGSAYARQHPPLDEYRYGRDDLIGNWPMKREQAASEATMWIIREEDYLWRMEADETLPVGIIASTEHATIGTTLHRAGARSGIITRAGDTGIYLEKGILHVELTETGEYLEIGPKDGCFIPAGTPHRFYNPGTTRVSALFAVAPDYLA